MAQWIHTESYLIDYGSISDDKSGKGFFSSIHKENVIVIKTKEDTAMDMVFPKLLECSFYYNGQTKFQRENTKKG